MQDTKSDEVVNRILERLEPSGWHEPLEFIIDSPAFREVVSVLMRDFSRQYTFFPKIAHWFRMFEECPIKTLRAVMITNLPAKYHKASLGIPFNHANGEKTIIHEWFERDIRAAYNDKTYSIPCDLSEWTRQGLLMLPCGLTNGFHGDHLLLWRPVMVEIADMLKHRFPDAPWVLMGRTGKWFEDFAPAGILHTSHPLNSRAVKWEGEGMFKKLNTLLREQGKDEFVW